MVRSGTPYRILVVALLGGMVLAGCAPEQPATAPPPTATSPSEPTTEPATGEPLVFGLVGPMTGDAGDYGQMQKRGATFAVEEINAAGGINGRPVELEVCDDKCDPTEGAMCAQRMINNPDIFAVIGHVCSSCTLAGGPIYEEAGMTFVTGSSSNPAVSQQGWTHMFRTIIDDNAQGPAQVQWAIETLGAKKLAFMYASHDYGQGMLDASLPTVPEYGGEVAAVETYAPGVDKDFSAQLTKIAETDPDALLLFTDYTEGAMITKQRVAAGLGDVPVVVNGGCMHQQFIELGGDAAEGTVVLVPYDPYSDNPKTVSFNEKWMEEFGGRAQTVEEAFTYEIPYMLKWAIEQGATKETLPDVLRTIDYEGPSGTTQFDDNGDVTGKEMAALIVKDGEWVSYTEQ